jgi:hypothetical protein
MPFAEGNETAQTENTVRREILELEAEVLEYLDEELRRRQGESTLDVGLDRHPLAGLRVRYLLLLRDPPRAGFGEAFGLQILQSCRLDLARPPSAPFVGGLAESVVFLLPLFFLLCGLGLLRHRVLLHVFWWWGRSIGLAFCVFFLAEAV